MSIALGKIAFVESRLFVGFPYLIQANVFHIAIVLVPMVSLARQLSSGVNDFESLFGLLTEMKPSPLRYPFAILGFSEIDSPLEITELTTELDNYLISVLGKTLDQMILEYEAPGYDFKEQLPDNKKVAQEVCGFANLTGGGIILLGINKVGKSIGISRGSTLDETQLQITNIIRSSCTPTPDVEFHVFDILGKPDVAIVVIRIHELERKPCMTQDRVYVRAGPSVRAATPEEIRRLVLD